jgi:hydroxymethylpyrimidine pyrophosphatase-like HAD family hydrolase
MKIVCDLDGTLCSIVENYADSEPNEIAIDKINAMHDKGDIIVIQTGRHWNHLSLTKAQLDHWGVKYDSLVMGKPVGDVYIDDLSVKSVDEFWEKTYEYSC